MNRPDAVFTDLDGTLLGPDKEVSPRDADAIRRLKELGIPVIPCTGRPPLGTRQVMARLGLELAVCSNGGCCQNFGEDRLLFAREMDHQVAHRLFRWLEEQGLPFLVHAPKQIFASPGVTMPAHYLLRGKEDGGVVTSESSLDGVLILKVLALGDDGMAAAEKARELFSPQELAICSSERAFVDFNPPGVSKGNGIRRLAAEMGWRLENILAMGDNNNDLSMLEAAGMGVAPVSGLEEAKAAADFVTSASGEAPLADAVEHYFPGLLNAAPGFRTGTGTTTA